MGSGGTAPPFLTSAPDGGDRSASRSGRSSCGRTAPTKLWVGFLVGPRTSLDVMENGRPVLSLVSIPTEPSPFQNKYKYCQKMANKNKLRTSQKTSASLYSSLTLSFLTVHGNVAQIQFDVKQVQ
jgi:hypothetical protein